ncbi:MULTISPECIES: hypothetical protein [unclassified Knoellia]|uniref:hypothetical protein n=1 Tax=Knoellia altitudinis TaxID=3404795 RepID=UPI00360C2EC8
MSDPTPRRPPLARNVSLLVAGVVVVELVFAAFLFSMGQLASASSEETGQALVLGAGTSVVAALVGVWLWVTARAPERPIALPVWVARALPLVAAGVAGLVAVAGLVPWLAVPLGLFAAAPVSVVALVVPQLLAATRVGGAGAGHRERH